MQTDDVHAETIQHPARNYWSNGGYVWVSIKVSSGEELIIAPDSPQVYHYKTYRIEFPIWQSMVKIENFNNLIDKETTIQATPREEFIREKDYLFHYVFQDSFKGPINYLSWCTQQLVASNFSL